MRAIPARVADGEGGSGEAVGVGAAGLSSCGASAVSSSVASAAKQAGTAVSGAAGDVKPKTDSAAQTTSTKAQQTAPAATQTVTKTEPGATTSVTNSTSVNVQGAKPASSETPGGSGGGLPWWAWVLIGAGVVALVVGIFALGRRRGQSTGVAGQNPVDPPVPSGRQTPTGPE